MRQVQFLRFHRHALRKLHEREAQKPRKPYQRAQETANGERPAAAFRERFRERAVFQRQKRGNITRTRRLAEFRDRRRRAALELFAAEAAGQGLADQVAGGEESYQGDARVGGAESAETAENRV